MQIQSVSGVLGQQIANLLIINFQVACTDKELSLLRVIFNTLKNIFKTTWHDTLLVWIGFYTSHSMRLACSSLAIRKDSSIIAFEYVLNDIGGTLIINVDLANFPIKASIKCKLFRTIICSRFIYKNLTFFVITLYNAIMPCLHFFLRHGSTTNYDLDSLRSSTS